jgi:ERCC4-type nuclease
MTVIVDTREPKDMKAAAHSEAFDRGFEAKPQKLGTGDFLAGNYLIERKTYPDFIGRLTVNENDIWSQLMSLNSACEDQGLEPALIIEGIWTRALKNRGVSKKQVNAAVEAVSRGLGIEVVPTFDMDMTAYVVCKRAELYSPTGETKVSASSIRDAPDVPASKRPRYLIEGLPHVGPKTAKGLLDEFGDAASVFMASLEQTPQDLTDVKGIGEKTAHDIEAALTR